MTNEKDSAMLCTEHVSTPKRRVLTKEKQRSDEVVQWYWMKER